LSATHPSVGKSIPSAFARAILCIACHVAALAGVKAKFFCRVDHRHLPRSPRGVNRCPNVRFPVLHRISLRWCSVSQAASSPPGFHRPIRRGYRRRTGPRPSRRRPPRRAGRAAARRRAPVARVRHQRDVDDVVRAPPAIEVEPADRFASALDHARRRAAHQRRAFDIHAILHRNARKHCTAATL
jgi:hypothetical protein